MLLLLTAVIDGVATTACNFEVATDGGPFLPADTSIPGPAQFALADTANVVDIRATAHSAEFWPVQGRYHVTGPGSLTPTDTPDNFAPPLGAAIGPFGGVSLAVYLSRLRDATADVLASLAAVPPHRLTAVPAQWPPAEWGTPLVSNIDVIDDPPIVGSDISATSLTLDPQTTDVVFERRGDRVPRLFAVSWPDSVPIWAGAGATPMLVYFHANMGQNFPEYYNGPYPYHFDYVFYGLWNYLNHRDSQLTKWPFSLGLPYQVAASWKPVVLVLPLSSAQQEIGSWKHADDMAITLNEIQGAMYRRAGVYDPTPGIGRMALAGFSGSTGLVAAFINDPANLAHVLMQQSLREVYAFDPPDTEIFGLAAAAANWLIASGAPDAMVRLYRQGDSPALAGFLGPLPFPQRPFVESTPDTRVTLGLIPAATWRAAAAARGVQFGFAFTEVHHMFPSMLLTDALRRSGF